MSKTKKMSDHEKNNLGPLLGIAIKQIIKIDEAVGQRLGWARPDWGEGQRPYDF